MTILITVIFSVHGVFGGSCGDGICGDNGDGYKLNDNGGSNFGDVRSYSDM